MHSYDLGSTENRPCTGAGPPVEVTEPTRPERDGDYKGGDLENQS